jgi:hypothetical protein
VRVRRAAWRREMAELERTWAIASAHAEGISIRKIVDAAGLGPTRVHAITREADLDSLEAALGELRSLHTHSITRPTAPVTGRRASETGCWNGGLRLAPRSRRLRTCVQELVDMAERLVAGIVERDAELRCGAGDAGHRAEAGGAERPLRLGRGRIR